MTVLAALGCVNVKVVCFWAMWASRDGPFRQDLNRRSRGREIAKREKTRKGGRAGTVDEVSLHFENALSSERALTERHLSFCLRFVHVERRSQIETCIPTVRFSFGAEGVALPST